MNLFSASLKAFSEFLIYSKAYLSSYIESYWLWKSWMWHYWSIFLICLYSLFSYTSPSANLYRFDNRCSVFFYLGTDDLFVLWELSGSVLRLKLLYILRSSISVNMMASHLTVLLLWCIQARSTCIPALLPFIVKSNSFTRFNALNIFF